MNFAPPLRADEVACQVGAKRSLGKIKGTGINGFVELPRLTIARPILPSKEWIIMHFMAEHILTALGYRHGPIFYGRRRRNRTPFDSLASTIPGTTIILCRLGLADLAP